MDPSERLQIAHFTNSYRPMINGVVRSITSFRKALMELGHNVFVFAPNQPGYKDEEQFVFRYPALDLGLPGDFPAPIPISNFVDRLLPSLKLDVIHSHYPVVLGQAAASKAKELNLPLVFTFHTRYREYAHYVPILGKDVAKDLVKDVIKVWLANYMKRCHNIIVPSKSMQAILERDYGARSPITVIPTGVEPEVFLHADGREVRQAHGWENQTILISVGRLASEKNWDTMLEAARQVFDKRSDTRLVIIGGGEDREKLEEHAAELGIADRVEWIGKVPFERIPAYLKAADLFCFTSATETQGLVTLEAMAAGLPIVAVDATGTRDVLENGRQGLLTENDPDAFAHAVLRVLNDLELSERFKDAGLKKAQELSIRNQAQKLLEVYHAAVESKKAGKTAEVEKTPFIPNGGDWPFKEQDRKL